MFISRRAGAIVGLFTSAQFEGQEFLPDDHAEIATYYAEVAARPPASVPNFKLRIALRRAGMGSAIATYVASLDQDTKDAWEYSTEVSYDSPFVVAACAAMNISEAQKAAVFKLADSL